MLAVSKNTLTSTLKHKVGAGTENAVSQLKKVFERLGLSTQQLVILCGAHYIGRWGRETTTDADIFDKQYGDLSKRFSNAYFKQVSNFYKHPACKTMLQR